MSGTQTTESLEKLHEDVLAKHRMYPFWVFADVGEANKGKFWCFIGAHYPPGLLSSEHEKYNAALQDLRIGHWKYMALQANPERKIGYGFGDTPSECFISACKMAGYIKQKGST